MNVKSYKLCYNCIIYIILLEPKKDTILINHPFSSLYVVHCGKCPVIMLVKTKRRGEFNSILTLISYSHLH